MTVAPNGIPALGLGTYGRTGAAGTALITQALALGYRHLDTAQSYGTEVNVGEALRRSGLPRAEVFITTKVATVSLARPTMLNSFAGSLERLGVDQVDLALIHWPSPHDAVPFEHYIEDLGTAQDRGYARLVGVSNFPIALLERATRILGAGRIVTNQVEVHPYLQNRRLRAYCHEHGIVVTAYRPLAEGLVAEDPVMRTIAARHCATAAQVSLAFLLAEGLVVIPSTAREAMLRENLGGLSLSLSDEDMALVRGLERSHRMINPPVPPAWDPS